MGNELEDFLKRAAQRRAENVAVRGEQQQREQQRPLQQRPPQQQRPPEYTDRNRERVATLVEDDEVIVAEVVPTSTASRPSYPTGGLAEQAVRTLSESTRMDQIYAPAAAQIAASQDVRAARAEASYSTAAAGSGSSSGSVGSGKISSASALVKLLKSPEGVRQAFLMREILDRPSSRW